MQADTETATHLQWVMSGDPMGLFLFESVHCFRFFLRSIAFSLFLTDIDDPAHSCTGGVWTCSYSIHLWFLHLVKTTNKDMINAAI